MNTNIFKPGTRVNFQGLLARATPVAKGYLTLVFDNDTIPPVTLIPAEVEANYNKNLFIVDDRIPAEKPLILSVTDKVELDRRKEYLDELKKVSTKGGPGGKKLREEVIARVKKRLKDPKGVSPAQLARWHKKATEHSQGIAATLATPIRKRKSNFSEAVQDIASRSYDEYWLVPGRPSIQLAYDCFVEDVNNQLGEDEPRPCYATYNKWIKDINPIDVIATRDGKKALRAATRIATKKLIAERILERVEVDAVHLAIGLVDDEGNYLGTVTLLTAIDCCSRSLLGAQVQIGRGEPSASVIDSFKHGISPKPRDSYSPNAKNTWPMFGTVQKYVMDGGPGYTSTNTQAFCMDTGATIEIVDTGKGWKKPYIERFYRTLRSQFACKLPGYCGKYTDQRQLDRTVKEQATLTPEEFYNLLTLWIIDEYHQSPHKGLNGKTPHQVWEEQAKLFPPTLPANYERIKYSKGQIIKRTIQGDNGHKGVEVNGVFYNDPEGHLKRLYMQLKAVGKDSIVTCEYSTNDISSINIIDPFTDEIFVVETYDERVTEGMSLSEFKAAHPTPKKNKGFGHKRVLSKNEELAALKKKHADKMKKKSSRKSTIAPEGEITAKIHEIRKQDPSTESCTTPDQDLPTPDETGFNPDNYINEEGTYDFE